MYVNDFEMSFINDNCPNIELQMLILFLLMYADDTVLFANSPEGLRCMLNSSLNYSRRWNLEVNVEKTKIIVFRNGGHLRSNESWQYNNMNVEIVLRYAF